MELFGIKVSKKSQVFFIMLLLLATSFFTSYAKNEVTLLVAIEAAWFVLFPYYGAYKAKSKHPKSKIIHNYFIIAIIGFIICFFNMFFWLFIDAFIGESIYESGFNFNLIYLFVSLYIILKNDRKGVQQKTSKNNSYINIDIKNLDFNELKKIPQEELERSMAYCLKNNGFSCMVGSLSQLNLLLSVDNQYSLGFNFLDTSVDIDFIESLARGMQTHNLKLVIISKEPYNEEIVNRCMTNGLGIELLIEEDFKNITNYFYRPKYDVLGSSFFDLLQNRVLKYKKEKNVTSIKDNRFIAIVLFLFCFFLPLGCVIYFCGTLCFNLLLGLGLSMVGILFGLIFRKSRPLYSKFCVRGAVIGFFSVILFLIYKLDISNLLVVYFFDYLYS